MLHHLFADAVDTIPGRPALIDDHGGTLTFAELDRYSAALAGWVAAHTDPGDRVAVVADNSVAYGLLYYAVPRAGRILALINQRLDPAEQAGQIAVSDPRILLGDSAYLDVLDFPVPAGGFGSTEWQRALDHSPFSGPTPAEDDPTWLVFTSGSTGKPKGVCQTHETFIAAAQSGVGFDNLGEQEDILSYLPMAWVGDHLFSYAQALVAGFTINCPESGETVMNDLREIGPTYYFAPPRVFENLLTQVMIRMEDAGGIKRKLFHHFMDVARRCGADILDGKPVSGGDRLQYWLGKLFIYGPLKNVLGLSRVRVAYTAGAAIGPDLFRFYRSIGINLKQLYGSTETAVFVCLQPDHEAHADTVGVPLPAARVKVMDDDVAAAENIVELAIEQKSFGRIAMIIQDKYDGI